MERWGKEARNEVYCSKHLLRHSSFSSCRWGEVYKQ